MAGLAPHLGRARAQELVAEAASRALDSGTRLRDQLLAEPAVTEHLDPAALDRLLDPAGYTGSAGAMTDAVLARAAQAGFAG